MDNWITTGFRIFWQWTLAVGVWDSLRGCFWVVIRKALPGQKALAKAVMPRLRIVQVQVPGYRYPFYARWPASDLHIAYTILTRKEYAPMVDLVKRDESVTFLDIGANIGAASKYLLETFPNANAIAVEPDPGNVQMCHKNLEPFGSRVRIVQAAAWSKNTTLVFDEETTERGVEAGVQVRESDRSELMARSVRGVDIPTLLAESGVRPGTQLAVKIDAEGSEEEIFGSTNLDWLNDVSAIAIELHDSVRPNCSRNFFSAIESHAVRPPRKINDTVFVRLRAVAVGSR